jgi:hypothetical protein
MKPAAINTTAARIVPIRDRFPINEVGSRE